MRRIVVLAACVAGAVLLAGRAGAANWPQWRGPRLNGSSPETGLPAEFGPEENVVWTAELPGGGGSTPIIWDDRVFISAQDEQLKTWAVCLSAKDGSELWRHRIGSGFTNRQGNTAASPSPVTDGRRVWFFYGTGELVAYDMEGREIWHRNIQENHGRWEYLWNYGSSALLHDGKLYIPVIRGDLRTGVPRAPRSYLLCVDAETGSDLWKHMRPSDAISESKQAYTTPILMEHEGQEQILVHGADHVTAHHPADGRELWRSDTYNPRHSRRFRTVASPSVCRGMVLVSAARGSGLFAIKPGQSEWTWTHGRYAPDVPVPLSYRGRFYVLDDKSKRLLAMDPESGQVLDECELGGRQMLFASPTGADGKIYCMNLTGEVFVISAGESLELLHSVSMGGRMCCSTISVAGGRLFIRADDTLYCIGGAAD